jgi:hypothetical protein
MKVPCPLKMNLLCDCTAQASCACICPYVLDQFDEVRRDALSGQGFPHLRPKSAVGVVS